MYDSVEEEHKLDTDAAVSDDLHAQVRALQTPGVTRSLEELRLRNPGRVSFETVQRELSTALGDRSLVAELYKMRGCDG